ncbi:MAG: hypothetical protein WC842_02395, partial [Candidatus Paceibacterota bacterium]
MKKFSFLIVLTLVLMGGFISAPKAHAATDIAIDSAVITSPTTILVTVNTASLGGDVLMGVNPFKWHIAGGGLLTPVSAVITNNTGPYTITLTFAAGTFASSASAYSAAEGLYIDAIGVVDTASDQNIVLTAPATSIAVTDGQKPTFVSASATSDTNIQLVFSETLAAGTVTFGAASEWTATGITSSNAVINGANVDVTVAALGDTSFTASNFAFGAANGSLIRDAANNVVTAFSGKTISDGQKPTLVSAKITSANAVTVIYSEAVTSVAGDYTDLKGSLLGRTVDGVAGGLSTTQVLTLSGAAFATDAAGTMDIGAGVTDGINTLTATNDSVVTDGQKPTLVSAKITAADTITVVYSESVTSAAGEYTALGAGLAGKTVSADSGPGVTHTLTLSAGGLAVNATGTMTIGTGVTDGTNTLNLLTDQLVSDGQVP